MSEQTMRMLNDLDRCTTAIATKRHTNQDIQTIVDIANLMSAKLQQLESLEEQCRWNNMKDYVRKKQRVVLVLDTNKEVHEASYNWSNSRWERTNGEPIEPTAWRYKPPPPDKKYICVGEPK